MDCEYLFHERMTIANALCDSDEHERYRVLTEGIQVGVAYHHAGLSDKQREMIENLFKRGLISVLVAHIGAIRDILAVMRKETSNGARLVFF